MTLEPGQTVLHYRIDRKIGEGGMGVVYLAEDTRLGRRVALKVLPAEMSADPARRARFEREARAIAALNHPNIVTLHSVEMADDLSFLTMEYVDGRRLTQLLARDGMPLGKLLDYSFGIADALVAAHRQGVVHRDLKPDNVMVTGDGRIKVLDFGLAKLRESTLGGVNTAIQTSSITEEGKILGTVAYMSPEQAEGKPLDQRSDIFSFGVVMYEMATGRRPFQGDTAISTISSILKDTPTALQQINTSLPAQLGRIVRRCLSKEPERRYQSTEDLLNELRELKEESESGELTVERSAASRTPSGAASRRPARAVRLGVAVVLVLVAIGAGWLWTQRQSSPGPSSALHQQLQMSRATTDGNVLEAAISPDGRYLAYVRKEGSASSLRLRQVVTGDEVQVVAASEATLTSPSFSSDGDFLHYVSIEPGKRSGSAQRVSVLGGVPRRIVDDVIGVTASPDGQRLALTGGSLQQSFVRVTGREGQDPHDLAIRKGRDHFDSNAVWSSDGRSLAIVSHRFGEPQQLVQIDPDSGQERTLAIPKLRSFDSLGWVPGTSNLVVAGSERPANQGGSAQLWELSTTGALEPLTRDLNRYSQVTLTSDGSTIAAVQVESRTGIEIASVRDGSPGAFTELYPISAAGAGRSGVAWLDGTRLAHGMLQGDGQQVFVTDVASKVSRQLTTGAAHRSPAVSRDGRTMVVEHDEDAHINLWRLDPETGREQRLTEGEFNVAPALTSDGSTILYSTVQDEIRLMKVPGTGGPSTELNSHPAACSGISVDDRHALCLMFDPSGNQETYLIPLGGGTPRPLRDVPADALIARFGPDGRSITYLVSREGANEIWGLNEGDKPRRLARFEGREIIDFAWSPDGSQLAVVKQTRSGDVVLLRRAPS